MSEDVVGKAGEASEAPAITRRTFAAGAAAALGSIILEPIASTVLGNTYELPGAAKAYGVEVHSVTVQHGKVCVMVYDPVSLEVTMRGSKQIEYAQPVRQTTVIVHSFDKNVDKKVTTDDNGCAFFDVKELANMKDTKMLGDYWEFAGSVQVFKNGYREVYYPCVQFSDAMAVAIPEIQDVSRITLQEVPNMYFRTIAMDGWNVQYQTQQFIGCEENTSEHELYVEFFTKNGGTYAIQPVIYKSDDSSRVGKALADAQTVECSLSSPLLGQGNYSNDWKYGKATFKGDFFYANSSKFINPGDEVRLAVSDPSKSGDEAKLYAQPTGIACHGTPCKGGRQEGNTILSFASNYPTTDKPMNATSPSPAGGLVRPEGNTFTLNDKWPGKMKSLTLDMWTPSLPVIFKYDPIGRFIFGVDLQFLEYNNLPEAPGGPAQWHKTSRESLSKQWDRKMSQIERGWGAIKNYKPKALSYKPNSSYSFIDLNLRFQALVDMKYKEDQHCWDGNCRAVVGGSFAIVYTAPFVFLAVPMYVRIDFSVELSLAVAGYLHSTYSETYQGINMIRPTANVYGVLRDSKFANEVSISPTFHMTLGASIAVGADKVASVGVRVSGGISLTLMFYIPKREGKKDPRFIFGYDYGLSVYAEVLIFTTSQKLWGDANPAYYDSDKANASAASLASTDAVAALAADSLSGADASVNIEDFSIVTDATLGKLAEVSVSTAGAAVAVASVGDVADEAASGEAAADVVAASDAVAATAARAKAAGPAGEAFAINDFTACGANASDDAVCATEMSAFGSGSSSSAGDGAALLANDDAAATFDYSWPAGHESKPDDRGTGSDVIRALGKNGGVEPRRMDRVVKDAYLAPSSRLVEIGTSRYLFRIATVTIDGAVRNRVVYQRISDGDVSKPYPVVFQDQTSGAESRADYYDYAFDVKLVNKQKDFSDVVLMVFSGKRPSDDETTIYSAAEATVLSAVRLVYDDQAAEGGCFTTKSCRTWHSPTYEESGKYFAFANPCLQTRRLSIDEAGFNRLCSDSLEHALGYFIINAASSKEKLLSPDSADVQVGLGIVHLSFGDDADELQVTSVDSIGKNVASIVIDTLQPHPSDSNSLYCTVGYKTDTGCGAKAVKIALERVGERNRMSSASAFDIIENDPKVKSLNPWNKKNTLLAAVSTDEDVNALEQTGYLALCATPDADQILAIENGSGSVGTFDKENTCVSPTDIPLGNVHVDASHGYCYYPSNHDGTGFYNHAYDESEEDGIKVTEASEDAKYLINAIAMADGVFTRPFVFADCGDNPVDSFCVVEDTSETNSPSSQIVTCSITDFDAAAASLYHFSVPFLASITVKGITLADAVVHAGDSVCFSIELANTGNTVMTKAVLNFHVNAGDGEMTELPQLELVFDDAENGDDYLECDYDYVTDYMSDEARKSMLVDDYGDAALTPGQTRTFLFEIPVQDGWEGECSLVVNVPSADTTIVDPCTGETVVASTSDNVEVYESTEANVASVAFTVVEAEEEQPEYGDLPDYIVRPDGDGDGDGGSGNGSGAKTTLASTGDALTGAGPLAAALAVAGAGMAAYSARRAKLENGEVDDAEDDE
jgi:hypothetical protein